MSQKALINGIPGTRYSTLVPIASCGVVPSENSPSAAAKTDETKAHTITVMRASQPCADNIRFTERPANVATNTIAIATASPPKSLQKAAFANEPNRVE